MTAFYVIEIELETNRLQVQETTGFKEIRVYDIDTQSMNLVEILITKTQLRTNSLELIKDLLKGKGYTNFVQL
jgi:hypothetical protein